MKEEIKNTQHSMLNEKKRDKSFERFRILQPSIEKEISLGMRIELILELVIAETLIVKVNLIKFMVLFYSHSLTTIARNSGIPLQTLKRWKKRYLDNGLSGLVRKSRTDNGTHRINMEMKSLIEALALQKPIRSIASIYRQTTQIAQQEGWDCPTYRTVVNVVNNLDPGLLTLAHEGSKVYRDNFDLIIRREAARSNEMWQADHCLLDIWLLDEKGDTKRPWLSVTLDDYSRAIPGYFIGFDSPDVLRTALMLRQAIWRKEDPRWLVCGIPDVFYTDNGSDYRSKHMEQVSADIKMKLVFSIPGRPRAGLLSSKM